MSEDSILTWTAYTITANALKLTKGEAELMADAMDIIPGGDAAHTLVTSDLFRSHLESALSPDRAAAIEANLDRTLPPAEYVSF